MTVHQLVEKNALLAGGNQGPQKGKSRGRSTQCSGTRTTEDTSVVVVLNGPMISIVSKMFAFQNAKSSLDMIRVFLQDRSTFGCLTRGNSQLSSPMLGQNDNK